MQSTVAARDHIRRLAVIGVQDLLDERRVVATVCGRIPFAYTTSKPTPWKADAWFLAVFLPPCVSPLNNAIVGCCLPVCFVT